jgi:hypothetical protein
VDRAIVITSIHGVTDAVEQFLGFDGWEVVLVGDRKTPDIDQDAFDGLTYLSIEDQRSLPGELHELPYDHYCRKNLGYQYAIQQGTEIIADTDDDNIPKADWDVWLSEAATERTVSGSTFANVYEYFTDDFVWPRGLPLDEVSTASPAPIERTTDDFDDVGVVQGLADVEPDVDAIFRLVFDELVEFDDRPPVVLEEGTYSPFNSQNTLWPVETLYPYLYLPSTVTFRFTDILRSYVAQRGLWAAGKRLAFTGASVVQDRNVHDLMADFESEIPCYLRTRELVTTLESLELSGAPAADLETIYRELAQLGIVESEELVHLDRWLSAI